MILRSSARQLSPALILVNPEAGGGRGRKARASVELYFKSQEFAAEFCLPANADEFERLARAVCVTGNRLVVAVGGDGTFQALINAAVNTHATLGLLPAGGGNDFAMSLGVPLDTIEAAHALLIGTRRRVDVLQAKFAGARTRCYAGGGGLGLDASAARLTSGKFRSWPGAARYVAAALWAHASFNPIVIQAEMELEDGTEKTVEARVLFAAVTNTPSYGAGVRIAPGARVDDGLLDIVLVRPLATRKILELIPRVLGTGDLRTPELERFQTRRVRLTSSNRAEFHGDGEILGVAPVEIRILPRAITVIAPSPSHK